VFSTKYEPEHPLLERWDAWDRLKQKFFGYERDLPTAVAAQILGGRVVLEQKRRGQRVAVIQLNRAEVLDAANGRENDNAIPLVDVGVHSYGRR